MNITFSFKSWAAYVEFQKSEKKLIQKINALIKDITRNGESEGLGRPEALKHGLSGVWSRRINKEHRLVYFVENNSLNILSCKGHYN
jgi:toxin YoeB